MRVGSLGTWRERYFELTEYELSYYPSQHALTPLGLVPLDCVRRLVPSHTDVRRVSLRVASSDFLTGKAAASAHYTAAAVATSDGVAAERSAAVAAEQSARCGVESEGSVAQAGSSAHAGREAGREVSSRGATRKEVSVRRANTRALTSRERFRSIELAAADQRTRDVWVRALTLLCGEGVAVGEMSSGSSEERLRDGGPPNLSRCCYGVALSRAELVADASSGLRVPSVLVGLWEELSRRGEEGLGSEGIFRLSANQVHRDLT
jgi:hypothetical protein